MRCLQCGKPLALLKKLTDNDFCSAEHRKIFLEEQQRLILERLEANRLRILKRRGNLDLPLTTGTELPLENIVPPEREIPGGPAAVHLTGPALPDQGSGLSDLCPFLTEGVYPKAGLAPPRYQGEPAPPDVRLISSVVSPAISAARTAAGSLLPLFLTARNSDRRYAVRALEMAQGASSGTVADKSAIQLPIPRSEACALRTTAGAFRMRPRGPLGCSAVPEFSTLKPAFELISGGLIMPRLQSRGNREYPLQFLDRFFRARARGPVDSHRMSSCGTLHLLDGRLSGACPAMPATPATELALACHGNPFHMGLEGPLACEGLRSLEPISPELLAGHPTPVIPALIPLQALVRSLPIHDRALIDRCGPVPTGGQASSSPLQVYEPLHPAVAYRPLPVDVIGYCAPPMLDRPFRMRPRNGMSSKVLAPYLGIPAERASAGAAPPVYGSLPVPEATPCCPTPLEKLYRRRPPGPVEDTGVRATEAFSPGILQATASPRIAPALSAPDPASCIPASVDRAYKMRPKGPVHDDGISQSQPIASGMPETLISSPLIQSRIAEPATEKTPRELDQPLRVHPLGPVIGHGGGESGCAPVKEDSLGSGPSLSVLHPEAIGVCAPAFLDKLYRMRPRVGVPDASLSSRQEIIGCSLELRPVHAIPPADLDAITSLAPALRDKLYRMRPRAGVRDGKQPSLKLYGGESDRLISTPVTPGTGLEAKSQLSPSPLSGLFWIRPPGPVEDPSLSAVEKPAGTAGKDGLLPLRLWASPPLHCSAVCAPRLIEKQYRMRPRAGVQDRNLSLTSAVKPGNNEPLLSVPWIPSAELASSSSLMPNFLDRAFRMRPRGPVQRRGAAAAAAVSPGPPALKISSLPSLPSLLVKACTPPLLDRAYRMRPRGPVPARTTAKFEPIQPGCAIAMSPAASLPEMPTQEERTPLRLGKPGKKEPRGPDGPAGNSLGSEQRQQEPIEDGLPVAFSVAVVLPCWPRRAEMGFLGPDPQAMSGPPRLKMLCQPAQAEIAPWLPRFPEVTRATAGPVFLDRLYRRKLQARGQTPTAIDSAALQPLAAHMMPPIPAVAGIDFPRQPLELYQLCRLWQSAPCQSATVLSLLQAFGMTSASPAVSMPATQSLPIREVPSFVNRLYRMWPRAAGRFPSLLAIAPSHQDFQNASQPIFPPAPAEFFPLTANPLPAIAVEIVNPSGKVHSMGVRRLILEVIRQGLARCPQQGVWGSFIARWSLASAHFKLASFALIVLFGILLTAKNIKSETTVPNNVEPAGWPAESSVDLTGDLSSRLHVIKSLSLNFAPLPPIPILRYALSGGNAAPDALRREQIAANGPSFPLSLRGKMVDFRGDDRLRSGGVGFLIAKGEPAGIPGIRVTHQFIKIGQFVGVRINESEKP